jgi:hypothetical protein
LQQIFEKPREEKQPGCGTGSKDGQHEYLAFVYAEQNVEIDPDQQKHERAADPWQNHCADGHYARYEKEQYIA